MGQAKQKAAGKAPDYSRIAGAIRKLAEAASSHLGADCYMHAQMAAYLLAKESIPAKVVVGHAAWRVGNGDGDVVLHAPAPNFPAQPGILFHAWVLAEGRKIFDVTSYQLRKKAAALDAIDGQTTSVDWCPDFILQDTTRISTLKDVIQKTPGLVFYQRIPDLEKMIFDATGNLDQGDLAALELLYSDPALGIVGPNNFTLDK